MKTSAPGPIRGSLFLLIGAAIMAVGRALADYQSAPEPGTAPVFWSGLLLVLATLAVVGVAISRQRTWSRIVLLVIVAAGWLSFLVLLTGSGSSPLLWADLVTLVLASASCALLWSSGGRQWFGPNPPPDSALQPTPR